MKEHLEKYIDYLSFEKRFSKHTIVAYKKDVEQFFEFIITEYKIEDLKNIDHQLIRVWIVFLKDNNVENRTIKRKISSLKTCFKFFLRENLIKHDPTLLIITPKQKDVLPVYFSNKKLSVLFSDLESKAPSFEILRDRLLLELLYSTGMRLSELINIKIEDCSSSQVKVLGKRNKERIIPITNSVEELINQYKTYRSELIDPDQYLLLTNKGKKMYPKFVYRLVNKYIGLVTNEKKRSPHTLRHSFATNMLNEGAKLHVIKEVLGHSNLSATQVYTHNSIDRLKETYKKFHPKENIDNKKD